eukprot:761032-Hanusia_phi.AAC.6
MSAAPGELIPSHLLVLNLEDKRNKPAARCQKGRMPGQVSPDPEVEHGGDDRISNEEGRKSDIGHEHVS